MNYELYYLEKKDGTYALHFPNNEGLTEEEVKLRFSAYGDVAVVNNRGQATGLCFVHYRDLEGVKRCLHGLQNDKAIKILPQKTKMHLKDKPAVQKKGNLSKHSSQQSLHSIAESKSSGKNKHKSTQDKRSGNKQQDLNTLVASQLSTANVDVNNGMGTRYSSERSLTNSVASVKLENDLRRKLQELHAFTKKRSSNSNSNNNSASNSCKDEAEIPGLMSINTAKVSMSTPNSSMSIKNNIIVAPEIIVANVHPKFGIHYILHLFEKHNPIAVSLMKKASKHALRYCHVYFKTKQEAIATQAEFDNYVLNEQNLIVLTPQKLMEEALF